jgi:TRAP transporter TAXI family solute receptor
VYFSSLDDTAISLLDKRVGLLSNTGNFVKGENGKEVRRIMEKNIRRLFLGLLIGIVSLAPFSGQGQEKSSPLSFGTSSVGSSNYVITVGMANILTKKGGINVTAEAVGGGDANIRALKDKRIDMAMLNSYAATNAFLGIEQFSKVGKVPLRTLVQGQERYNYIVVRKDSGIKTPADLRGKKFIGKRRALRDIDAVTHAMLKAYNVPMDAVKILETAETNEALEALKTGAVDGAQIPGGGRASNLMDLARDVDVAFLSIPDDKFQLMLKELGPAFQEGEVAAGVYKGQDSPLQLPLLLLGVTVRSDFPEETAYKITKSLMENQKELEAVHNVGKEWTLKNTLKKPPVPFHTGAIKYFKEKGAWSAALEQTQQQLLKMGP